MHFKYKKSAKIKVPQNVLDFIYKEYLEYLKGNKELAPEEDEDLSYFIHEAANIDLEKLGFIEDMLWEVRDEAVQSLVDAIEKNESKVAH